MKVWVHQAASERGLVVTVPDSSPRGCNSKADAEGWDSHCAGFCVDASEEPRKTGYRTYSSVPEELRSSSVLVFQWDPKPWLFLATPSEATEP